MCIFVAGKKNGGGFLKYDCYLSDTPKNNTYSVKSINLYCRMK